MKRITTFFKKKPKSKKKPQRRPTTWRRHLDRWGITDKDFERHKAQLSRKLKQEVSDDDVTWAIFSDLLQKGMKEGEFQELSMIYYEMALFQNKRGKECFQLLQQAAKMRLNEYKQSGVKKVQVQTVGDSCPACRKLEGRVFTVKQALEKMPIPCKKCTFKLYDDQRGFCRCHYLPVVD
jgi:hypothetical protein